MQDLSSVQLRQTLRNLGFSQNEIRILTFLLQEKKGSARTISQQTTLTFSAVQLGLSTLCNRNIIHCGNEKEEMYEICSNREFIQWIEDQKQEAKKVYDHAKTDLEHFFELLKNNSWKPGVLYYEGKEGIIEIYKNMLQTAAKADKKIHSWLDIKRLRDVLGDYLYEYIETRISLGIYSHDIVPENEVNLAHAEKGEQRDIKFAKNMPIDGEIRIFGDKVAVITFDKEKPVGFVFEGAVVTSLFKAIFQSMWEHTSE